MQGFSFVEAFFCLVRKFHFSRRAYDVPRTPGIFDTLKRRGTAITVTAGVVLIGVLGSACSSGKPEVLRVSHGVYQLHDTRSSERYEVLSIAAQVLDNEGFDRIRELYVIHDDAGLVWELKPEFWSHTPNGADRIGHPRLVMPDRSEFPRGDYRVVITNVAGERGERRFTLDTRENPEPFPRLGVSGIPHDPVLESNRDTVTVYLVSENGSVQGSLDRSPGPLSSVVSDFPDAAYIMLLVRSGDSGGGFISGPYRLF
jgi:hypothetical protein